MKIAQVLDSLGVGGAQKMQVFLAETFQSMPIELTVVSLDDDPDPAIVSQLQAAGARVVEFPFPRFFSPLSFIRLTRFFYENKFDLANTYLAYSNIFGSFAGFITGTPVIASLRSAAFNQSDYSRARARIEDFALSHLAARILANGSAVAEFARARAKNTPVDILVNAVLPTPPISSEEREAIRADLMGDSHRTLIISVGRLSRAKAFPDLINTAEMIKNKNDHFSLAIVGDGDMMSELKEQVRAMDLEDCVRFAGQRYDIPRLLASADIYVNSSTREGTSVSILEAMSAGLPVVATAVGEAPFLFKNGEGILVPPSDSRALADALLLLLSDPEKRKKMGSAGAFKIYTGHTRREWARNLLSIYAKVSPKAADLLAQIDSGALKVWETES